MMLRALLLIVSLLFPASSWAALANVSHTESTDTASVSSITLSVTVPSGSDRGMLVCVHERSTSSTGGTATQAVTSMVFNGSETLTKVRDDSRLAGGGYRALRTEGWYLAAPTVTTANLVTTFAGVNDRASVSVDLVTGMKQTAPVDSHAGAQGETNAPTVTITTVSDGAFIIDCPISEADGGLTVGAGQTMQMDRVLGSTVGVGVSTALKATAGAEAMNWTNSGLVAWVTSTFSVVPSGGAEPPPVVPGQVTLTWSNCTDPGNPSSGVANTAVRRCTGTGCTVATTGLGIGSVAFPQTTFIDNTVAVGTTYRYAVFCTDFAGNAGLNSNIVSVTTSGTPPPTPPTLTSAAADPTGANLTYGGVTPTKIRVNVFSNSRGAISSQVYPISSFPSGRWTQTWINGMDGVCFIPISAADVENNAGSGCDDLTEFVGQLDTTPPVLSACQPTTDLSSAVTSWEFSCLLDKPGAGKWSETADVAYADMANTMTTAGLTVSATFPGLTSPSTRTIYLRAASQDIFDDLHPTTSDTPITITVASGGDVTPPGDVTNNVCTVLGNAISCTWDAATGTPIGYVVYLSTDNVTFVPAGNPTAVTGTVLQLSFNTTYYIKIKAVDAANNLSALFSNTETKTTTVAPDNTIPPDLGDITLEAFKNSIRTAWPFESDSNGPLAVNLEHCLAEVGQEDCANFNVAVSKVGTPVVIRDLLSGRRYCVRGKNTDSAGNTSVNYSATVCADTATTGIAAPRLDIPFSTPRQDVTVPRLPNATQRIPAP